VTPVGPELVGVAVLTHRRGRSFDDWMSAFPALARRLDPAAAASRTRGAGPLERNIARRVVGRVLLVGDAAGYVDALTGEGIAVGMAAAERLVSCVLTDNPDAYEAQWLQVSRRYRVMTRTLLFAALRPPLRSAVVPAAAALPSVFGRAIDALAEPHVGSPQPPAGS
jgi:flavin-dependent dehydrogenase